MSSILGSICRLSLKQYGLGGFAELQSSQKTIPAFKIAQNGCHGFLHHSASSLPPLGSKSCLFLVSETPAALYTRKGATLWLHFPATTSQRRKGSRAGSLHDLSAGTECPACSYIRIAAMGPDLWREISHRRLNNVFYVVPLKQQFSWRREKRQHVTIGEGSV